VISDIFYGNSVLLSVKEWKIFLINEQVKINALLIRDAGLNYQVPQRRGFYDL